MIRAGGLALVVGGVLVLIALAAVYDAIRLPGVRSEPLRWAWRDVITLIAVALFGLVVIGVGVWLWRFG